MDATVLWHLLGSPTSACASCVRHQSPGNTTVCWILLVMLMITWMLHCLPVLLVYANDDLSLPLIAHPPGYATVPLSESTSWICHCISLKWLAWRRQETLWQIFLTPSGHVYSCWSCMVLLCSTVYICVCIYIYTVSQKKTRHYIYWHPSRHTGLHYVTDLTSMYTVVNDN